MDDEVVGGCLVQHEMETEIAWLDALEESLRTPDVTVMRQGGIKYQVEMLIRYVMSSELLRDQGQLQKMLLRANHLLVPAPMRASLASRLTRSKGRFKGPQRETIRSYNFYVDVAYMLWRRVKHGQKQVITFQIDSSPQAGFNWLLSSYCRLSLDDLPEMVLLVQQLSQGEIAGSADMNRAERMTAFQALTDRLQSPFDTHFLPPAALGSGAEDLSQKMHALIWSCALECDSPQALREFLSAIISVTSDFGTEIGIADFANVDLEKWLNDSGMKWPTIDEDELQPLRESDGESRDYLFDEAISIPGLLHIVHNALRELSTEGMVHWSGCLAALKTLNKFLTQHNYKERFVETCVGQMAPQHAVQFQRTFTAILDWRFAVVQSFLQEVLPLRQVCSFDLSRHLVGHVDCFLTQNKDSLIVSDKIFKRWPGCW